MVSALSRRYQGLALVVVLTAASCARQPAAPTPPGNSNNPAPSASLHGLVREAIPVNPGAPVASALVEIVYQSGKTRSTTTAADGSYRLDGIAIGETLRLTVSREGYGPSTTVVAIAAEGTTADVSLRPFVTSVVGNVSDASAAGTPVDSAVITIVTGPNRGRTFISDAAGAFTLDGVWAEFDISVARAGFDTATTHVTASGRGPVAVRLTPNATREYAGFTGELCTTERLPPWLSCTAPFERTHSITVRRPGSLALTLNYAYVGDYYPNSLTLDVRCGSRVIAEKMFVLGGLGPPYVVPDNKPGPVEIPLAEACVYDLQLRNFIADTKGGSQTKYRLDVEFPR